MVDLPSIPKRLALFEGGKSSVTASDVSSVYGRWGQAAQDVATGIDTALEPVAQEAGRKAVTRDADGNIQVDIMPVPGKLGEVYRRTAEHAFAINAESAVEKGLLDLRQKTMRPVEKGGFGGDPRMFEEAARQFVTDFASRHFGGFQKIAEEMGTRAATQHMRSLMIERERLDVKSQNDTLAAKQEALGNDLLRIAHDNGADSDEFRQKAADYDAINMQRTRDPRFNYSTGEAQITRDRVMADAKGQAIVGAARRYYAATGDLAGAQSGAEEALAKTSMPIDKRHQYIGQISRNLDGARAMRGEQAREITDRASGVIGLLQHATDPLDPFDPSVDETVAEARRMRLHGVAARLDAARTVAIWTPMLDSKDAGERAEAMAAIREATMAAVAPQRPEPGAIVAPVVAAGRTVNLDALQPRVRAALGVAGGILGYPIEVTYGVEGRHSDRSQHYSANAVDIRIKDEKGNLLPPEEIARRADALVAAGFTGIHQDGDHLHADMRPGPVWRGPIATPAVAQALDARRFLSGATDVARAPGVNQATPEAKQAWGDVLKETQKKYDAAAGEAWASITKAIDAGRSPSDEEMRDFVALLPMIGDADTRKKIGDRLAVMSEGERQLAGAQNIAQARATLDQMAAAAQRGELSPVQREALDQSEKIVKAKEKAIADDPVSYGAGQRIPGMPRIAPLDFTSPEALRTGLDVRRKMRSTVAQMEPMTGDSALTATDRAQVAQVLRSGDPAQAALALTTMATVFSPAEFRAAMADSGIKDAVIGMAKTGDMTKMQAAFAVLDGEFQRNAAGFDDVFGADTRRLLTTWQSRISTQSPQQVFDLMRKAQEPSAVAAQKALKDEADEKLKAVTADKVVGYFSGLLSTAGAPVTDAPAMAKGALLAEYRQEFREIYAMSGDENAAKAGALKAIGAKWGVSEVNGGRVMSYPPERTYQPVNGSHDWMGPQADEAVRAAMLFSTGDVARWGAGALSSRGVAALAAGVIPGPAGAAARAVTGAPTPIRDRYSLIGDTRTQADKAAGRPASYGVVVMDNDGRFSVPMDATGAPLRITFDRQRAVREAEGAFTDRRETKAGIKRFLGLGG